jgi:hypothetical protein
MATGSYATYQVLSSTTVFIEVNYANGGFGMERVTVRPGHSLYEAAFAAASVKASIQGERLERFARG